MALVLELIRDGQQRRGLPQQQLTHGTLIRPDSSRFRMVAGGQAYESSVGLAADLRPGDRVWAILGRGTPKIIGVMGPDGNIPR